MSPITFNSTLNKLLSVYYNRSQIHSTVIFCKCTRERFVTEKFILLFAHKIILKGCGEKKKQPGLMCYSHIDHEKPALKRQ